MSTITLKIPDETNARLEAISSRRKVSKSKVVRDALEKELIDDDVKPSLYDLMKEGLGIIDSGVTDRATNKKYMEGFGKWRK